MAVTSYDNTTLIEFYELYALQKMGELEVHQEILSITLGDDILFVTTRNNSLIIIANVTGKQELTDYDTLAIITYNYVQGWPGILSEDDWKPSNVYYSRYVDDTVFVQSKDYLYIMDYSTGKIVLVNTFNIPSDKGTPSIFIGLYSLVVVYQDQTIKEYDI